MAELSANTSAVAGTHQAGKPARLAVPLSGGSRPATLFELSQSQIADGGQVFGNGVVRFHAIPVGELLRPDSLSATRLRVMVARSTSRANSARTLRTSLMEI